MLRLYQDIKHIEQQYLKMSAANSWSAVSIKAKNGKLFLLSLRNFELAILAACKQKLYIKNEGAVLGLTLCILIGSSMWLDKLNLGWFIMHIKGSKERLYTL